MNAWLRIYKMWLRCAYKRCCAYLQPNLSAERTSAYFNSYHFLTFSSSTSKHYDNLNWKWNIFSNFKYISPKKMQCSCFFAPRFSVSCHLDIYSVHSILTSYYTTYTSSQNETLQHFFLNHDDYTELWKFLVVDR